MPDETGDGVILTSDGGGLLPEPLDPEFAERAAAEVAAARRLSAIEAGRRKGGVAGAAMAGAMLAISEIYEGPKRDEFVAVSEAPDEPDDIDFHGIAVNIDGAEYWAPPPHRHDADLPDRIDSRD